MGTDRIRKELTGRAPTDHDFADPGAGIYAAKVSRATYDEAFRRTALLLAEGESVVLDASFGDPAEREPARQLAGQHGADLTELECVLDSETAKQRIERRLEEGRDPSDARPEILDDLRALHAPWPEATPIPTAESIDAVEAAALAALRGR